MNPIIAAVKLHLNKREFTMLVPLYCTALAAVLSALVSFLYLRGGSIPGSDAWVDSSRANPAMLWALAGYLGYLGVQSVATTFPFALTLGATRKSFTAGTLLWMLLMSAYLTAVMAVLAFIEVNTGHWFSGFYIFDVNLLGAGDLGRLIPTVFLATLTLLSAGGVFGAAWVRYGSLGPVVLASGIGIVLIVAAIILVPTAAEIFAGFRLWWLAVAALAAIALSSVGTWLHLRPAIVR